MDIRHDLDLEMENTYGFSADDYEDAQNESMWESDEDGGFDPEMFDDYDADEYLRDLAAAQGVDDSEVDYDEYSYDGESADFGLFDEF